MLKHLQLYYCSGQKSLRVSALNLTRLKFSDGSGKLFLQSVPKLVEAKFRLDSQRIDVVQYHVASAFRFSSQLEVLKLSLERPKELLANEFIEMPKLRKLVVEFCAAKTQSLLPVTLLWASPHLQEFKLKCWDTRRTPYADAPLQVRRNGEKCRHLRLKLFELEGLVDGSDGHIELVTYISDNCVKLEKIKIFLGSSLESIDQKQATTNYIQKCLQGKLPQHIQLQLC